MDAVHAHFFNVDLKLSKKKKKTKNINLLYDIEHLWTLINLSYLALTFEVKK